MVDEAYTRLLMRDGDLPFEDVLALDRVQKGQPVPDTTLRKLRRKGLIEGRKPHLRVSASVAKATGTQADYIQSRGHSDEYCSALITDYLKKHGRASRSEIDKIVYPALSIELSDEQKSNKVKNLLSKMRREGAVKYDKKNSPSGWILG